MIAYNIYQRKKEREQGRERERGEKRKRETVKVQIGKKRVNKANYGALAHHRNQARSQDSVKREGVL